MQSWKRACLVIITVALWQLMHLGTCWTIHHVPTCMSCHKAIVVITGRAYCFYDSMYIMLILLLWDLSTLCVVDHLWPLMHIYSEVMKTIKCANPVYTCMYVCIYLDDMWKQIGRFFCIWFLWSECFTLVLVFPFIRYLRS